jgi:hypothetical protein
MGTMEKGHTSERLRLATVRAVNESQRPIAAHEVEEWINFNDAELSKELSSKCYDYVRIILSLTPRDMIVKYKCDFSVPGVDRRASFYGLPDCQYDPAIWKPIGRKSDKKRFARRDLNKNRPKEQLAKRQPPAGTDLQSLFGPQDFQPVVRNVDDRKCENAWFALTTFVPPNDDFWQSLMEGIDEMRAGVKEGRDPNEVLTKILKEKPGLVKPVVLSDVLDILSKEALLEGDEFLFGDTEVMFF